MRKAVAARKPKVHRTAGSGSRIDALALRLHRSGRSWTLKQYISVSAGVGLFVAALVFLKSGARCWRWRWACSSAAACRTSC